MWLLGSQQTKSNTMTYQELLLLVLYCKKQSTSISWEMDVEIVCVYFVEIGISTII